MKKEDFDLFVELKDYLLEQELENPVAIPVPTDEMYSTFDLELRDNPMGEVEYKEHLKLLLKYVPKTSTSKFYNQLFGGRNGKALIGELLTAFLNISMYTYKVAGPMIGVEQSILNYIANMAGYPSTFGGTFPNGGSMSNFMGMVLARDAKTENSRDEGIMHRLRVYTSSVSHYSTEKNASFAGIGKSNVCKIKCDDLGRMLPNELEEQINEDLVRGYIPILINATSGTTVLGSFDPIPELSEIAEKYNIWLHVDAAFGGSALFSDDYKHLMKGLEKSDSFCMNAHKMLGTPLACSMFFAKDGKQLYHSFSNEADYLYQMNNDAFNPGKVSFNCGRRNDAFKFWTLWKAIGTNGIRDIVNHEFEISRIAHEYIRSNSDYKVYNQMPSITICFNYKDIPAEEICTKLYEESELMVGYGSFREDTFIRLVTVNSGIEKEDILNFFKKLEAFVDKHF